ncbi:MAG: HlyD family efflux transporter periplasmic adaptor subunit [Lentisphaeria bacterium]|nr:HlyD family efflux transporter periplasmic adaptor subunit [Lentisphaeria bacterium]
MRWSILAVSALLLAAGCEKPVMQTKEKTTRVNISKLQKRIFRQRIPLQGTIQPVEFATISAKIGGTLEMLKVSEGDKVKKGDLLFGIDRQVLKNQVVVKEDEIKVRQAALQSAEISLNIAKISYDQAKRDFDRAKNLSRSKAISESSLESAETDFRKAEMAVNNANASIANAKALLKQAESNLAIARKNLDDSTTAAPFDCVVFDKFVEENEFVSAGQEILKLENHDALEVVCFISAVYYNAVIEGKTPVDFTDRNGKAVARSVITYKAPGIDPESRTFKIKVAIPKEANPVSGMLCELDIILAEREGYGLPESAILLRAENRMIAYTVNDKSRAESVEIKRGIIDGGFSEVLNAENLLSRRFVITGQTFINNGSLLVDAAAGKK